MEGRLRRRRKGQARVSILALLLITALTVNPLSPLLAEVSAASVENPWDGVSMTMPETDENGTYLIRTGAELAWFAAEVNGGRGEINGRLENYIYLNDYNTSYNWTMIGDTEEHPYRGSFDGNGQKVVYMRAEINMKNPERKYAGLFGVIDGGTVQNLTVLGKVIQGYGNYGSADGTDQQCAGSGGIAGYLKSGQIVNCINYARTTMDGEAMYRNSGGIVGICKGLVVHCENYGKLSTTVGIAQNHIGGIAGLVYGVNAQVDNSVNYATVQGYFCVGGLAGAVKAGGEIHSSCNYGAVKGNSLLGGIAGRISTAGLYNNGGVKQSAIRNVYNLGSISGYGTGAGSEAGGIVGQMGYESWKQEAIPPAPLVENAYSAADLSGASSYRRGGIIGYLLSGSYGTVYGCSNSGLLINPVGAKNDRGITILGEARMLTEEEMKSAVLPEKLGSAFTMSNKYDTENNGFPKLAWQSLPSDLLDKIDQGRMELNGWLTDVNKKKYGKNYTLIETLVSTYKEKLGTVSDEEELEAYMAEAREQLNAVKPGIDADNELAEAIDNGIIALEEYCRKLTGEHTDLTDSQKMDMNNLTGEWSKKLEGAATLEEVRLLIRDGKDALEAKIASFEEDKRLEEIRSNALQVVTDYRADETYDVTWMHKIKLVRDEALKQISAAATAAEVTRLMEQAKNDIDGVIDQIPEAGAWDGVTLSEPELSADGIYQITSGSELAWFANAVNTAEGGSGLCGALCNDISLGFYNWTPIGSGRAFSGSFEGGGYTVRGLFIDLADTYAGLFGKIEGGGGHKIQNLTVSGTIAVDGKVTYAGGIAAYVSGASSGDCYLLENCHSRVSITLDGVKALDTGIGGIAGRSRYAILSCCSNTGPVTLGEAVRGNITYYAGGLVGSAYASTTIQRSYNSGIIYSTYAAGGLVGLASQKDSGIYASYNTGEVTGKTYAGGLGGSVLGNNTAFNWCYSSGPVNLRDSGYGVGALFGNLASGSDGVLYALKRSDSLGRALVGISIDFTATGKFISEAELAGDDILNALNGGGGCYIHDYLGFQNGYPILDWQLTLDGFRTGAITELSAYAKQEDYTEENWAAVQAILAEGVAQIQAAADMPGVSAAMTQAKNQIDEVETKAGTAERKLQEARDEAISILENYVDLSVYRDQEQTEIRNLIARAKSYILLADSLEEVQRHLDETRASIDALPDAWTYYNQVNMAAAGTVDAFILEIGEVIYVDYVKLSILTARDAYDKLTEEQKALVMYTQVLLDAEAAWEKLAEENEPTDEDRNLAAAVDALIGEIGTVTADSGDAIAKARHAYDGLTDKQKNLVGNAKLLLDAESAYNKLCADPVASAIAAIGEITLDKKEVIFAAKDAYDALSDAQKVLVQDYQVLENAIITYQNLVVAQPVIEMISGLGDVGSITLGDGNAILAAIAAYNMLTGEQQALVTNYDILEAAASVYDSLSAIQNVMILIDRIGAVSQASGGQIAEARAAYNSLTPDQQRRVTNGEVLENAEKAFAALQSPQVDTNVNTGGIQGNTAALAGGGQSSGSAGTGGTVKENGTAVENGDAGQESSAEEAEAESTAKDDASAEDGALPEWLENQLNGSAAADTSADAESLALEQVKMAKRKNLLLILGIILAACGAVTGALGFSLRKAAGKRKEKKVHL